MKKIHMISALLAMLLPTALWAGSDYYASLTVQVSTSGGGKVYASTSNTENANQYGSAPSAKGSKNSESSPVNVSLYAFAKADFGYRLKGWSETDGGTTLSGSNVNPFEVKISTAQKDSNNPESVTRYAVFEQNPDSCTLTLNKPEGLASYTVTAPSGFPANLSQGGSATVYKGDQYSFKYTLSSDEYDFINWTVNGEQKTSNPVSVTISGNTTVVLTLKKKVTYYATCQGSVGGTYKANNTTVSSSDQTLSNFASITVNLSNPVANTGYAFYGWYKLYSNGVKEYLSYYTSVSTGEMKENIVIGAEFREVQDCTVNFIAPAEGKITYAISGGNSGEVDDADKSETVPAGADVTLNATCDYANRRAKWYTKDDSGEKVYFSIDKNLTKKFASSVALGVDFIPVNEKIVNAIEAAQSSSSHEAILAADAEIVLDTSIEIPSGIKIDLDGHTLYVDGTLTVNGTLVNGTVSKCQKLLKQTGDGLSPCNPYGSIKYWKTATATSSASITGSGWSGTPSTHVTIMRGDGVAIRKVYTGSPTVLKCKADANIAANHITSITSAETGTSRTDDKLTAPPSYDATDLKTQKASLMPISASGEIDMLVLVASGVSIAGKMRDGDSQSRYYYQGVVDCAEYDCGGMSNNVHNEHRVTYLNGGTVTVAGSVKFQNALVRFCNCKVVNTGKARNTPHYCFYDCELSSLSFSKHSDGGTADVRFFGGKYAYGFDDITDPVSTIYAGAFSPKPDKETWVDKDIKSKVTFVQHADSYWYLEPNQDPNVARIGSTPYLTLELALDYLNENDSATITLLRDVRMESAYTLEAGKSLVIELGGCHIDAPNGFIKNYGSLSIRDNNNSLAVCGVTVGSGSNIIENYDNGTVDICYGLYNGNFAVNGGTFTTHHGKFVGSVAKNGGTVNLKGGVFSSDVSSLMNEGYHAFAYSGWYYVGRFPKPEDDSSSISGFSRKLTAMLQDDKTLYLAKKTAPMSGCSSVDEWKRVAKLKAAYALYADEFYIDILIGFDREVAEETAQASVKVKGVTKSEDVPHMNAGVMERVFSPRITQTQISYERFIYDNGEGNYDTMEAGISDKNNANNGTVCVLAMDLWKYDKTKTKKESYLTILALPYVFGAGSNKAMIRPAEGAADFNSTLQGAIGVVKNNGGGTVMLANNCNEIPSFDTVGTYIVDSMGFEHSFSGAEGGYTVAEGLSVATEIVESSVASLKIDGKAVLPDAVAIKYVVTAAAPPHPADYVVIPSEHLKEWKSENGINGSTESEIREALKQEDENHIPKWENVVMGQNGADKPAIVTSTNGTAEVAEMVVSFNPPSNIGYTVKYAFDKTDSTGTVVENGAGDPQEKPELDLTEVTTNTPSYFKMRAVLESNDGNYAITTNVPVDKVIGVLKVDSDATFTILAVPWKSFDGGNVKVSELVHAASLSTDDMLYAYDNEGKLESWCVSKGVWVKMTEQQENGQQVVTSDPTGFGIARGKGVWLKRENVKSPIYLMGQPTTEAVTNTLTAATDENTPSWNLVASPKFEAVDWSKFSNTDEIIVPTASTPKHYTCKNGEWGYPGATVTKKTLPNGNTVDVIKTERKTDDTAITPGTGFWYLNKGAEKTIDW